MKSLVIGSEGNIGKPFVGYLKQRGHEVLEADIHPAYRPNFYACDINHPLDLLPAFDRKPEVVYLLAGMVSRVTCEQSGSLAIATNLAGVNNVVQLCKRVGAKLVFFSTSEVYGPTRGKMYEESVPHPNNRYGLSKHLAEQLIVYESEYHGLSTVILRPFMVYGEHEERGDHRSAVIRFAYNMSRGRAVEVHRGAARSWLHILDAVRAIEAAGQIPGTRVPINIGHPNVRSVEEMAELVRAGYGAPKGIITYSDLPDQMTSQKIPALELQEHLLGFTPEVSLEEGIARVCVAVR